jgi:hypothetical protein
LIVTGVALAAFTSTGLVVGFKKRKRYRDNKRFQPILASNPNYQKMKLSIG